VFVSSLPALISFVHRVLLLVLCVGCVAVRASPRTVVARAGGNQSKALIQYDGILVGSLAAYLLPVSRSRAGLQGASACGCCCALPMHQGSSTRQCWHMLTVRVCRLLLAFFAGQQRLGFGRRY
jgi:hypothetical protein